MADFVVTTTSDTGDDATVTGDLAAEIADGGGLSLREALILANANPDADTITFDASLAGLTIILDGTELVLTSEVLIDGDLDDDGAPDVTIDANGQSRVLTIGAGFAEIDGLVLTGGLSEFGAGILVEPGALLALSNSAVIDNSVDSIDGRGGGILVNEGIALLTNTTISGNSAPNGGGLFNYVGFVALSDSVVSENGADYGGGVLNAGYALLDNVSIADNFAGYGGGLLNAGDAAVSRSTISNNYAEYGGGLFNAGNAQLAEVSIDGNYANVGGGVFNVYGSATLYSSSVSGNYAANNGAGMYLLYATTSLYDTTVSGNYAVGSGGGIFNADGSVTLATSTVADNYAGYDGGGIYSLFASTSLDNSTVSGNYAYSSGGGIYNYDGSVTLANTTVANNYAGYEGGGITNTYGLAELNNTTVSGNSAYYGGGIVTNGGITSLYNSIVLGNANGEISDFLGGLTTAQNSLVGDGTVVPEEVFEAVDPFTGGGLLANNGGLVETIALLQSPDNPALDASGTGATDVDARGELALDQPGIGRDGAGIRDLGAFEMTGPLPLNDLRFFLIDPRSDEVLFEVFDGDDLTGTLGSDGQPLREFNISVVYEGENTVESVLLGLNDREPTVENFEPYALLGDNDGDFRGRLFPDGTFAISASAFSENRAQGIEVASETISLNFDAPESTGDIRVFLVDPVTNEDIQEVETLDTLTLEGLQSGEFNLRAEYTGSGTVESMRFFVDGERVRTENAEPYALFSDSGGDFRGEAMEDRTFELRIEAYSENGGRGDLVAFTTLQLITDPDGTTAAQQAETLAAAGSVADGQLLAAEAESEAPPGETAALSEVGLPPDTFDFSVLRAEAPPPEWTGELVPASADTDVSDIANPGTWSLPPPDDAFIWDGELQGSTDPFDGWGA